MNTCTAVPFLIPLSTPLDLLLSNQPPCYCHFFFFSFCVALVQEGIAHVCSLLEWPHHITSGRRYFIEALPSSSSTTLFSLFFDVPWVPGKVIIVVLFMAETSQSFILSLLMSFESLHSPPPTTNSSSVV